MQALRTHTNPYMVIVENITIPADAWQGAVTISRDLQISGWTTSMTVVDSQGASGVLRLATNDTKVQLRECSWALMIVVVAQSVIWNCAQ